MQSNDKTLNQLKSFRDTLRNPGAGSQKVAIGIIILFALLLIIGLWGYATSDDDGYLSDDTSSSQSAYSSDEEEYLMLLELDAPHNFASDADAIQFGKAVCETLDTEYLEDFGDYLDSTQYGILRGVNSYSRGYGVAAAGMVFCPEHLEEIMDWAGVN